MLKYISAATAPMGTNCYVVFCTDTLQAAVIDPADADTALAIAGREGLTIGRILLTHGHFDHIGAVDEICAHYDAPLYMHIEDISKLSDAAESGELFRVALAPVTEMEIIPADKTGRALLQQIFQKTFPWG